MGSRSAETAERIFTIYTSYDVFPRQDVPFGGPVVTAANLWGQKLPKPQFWGVNRRFQA